MYPSLYPYHPPHICSRFVIVIHFQMKLKILKFSLSFIYYHLCPSQYDSKKLHKLANVH